MTGVQTCALPICFPVTIRRMKNIRNFCIIAHIDHGKSTLLKEYLESQKTIKNKFRADFSQENLSDAEAKKMLNQSFDLGQQLLNNRKVYADKFLKILNKVCEMVY